MKICNKLFSHLFLLMIILCDREFANEYLPEVFASVSMLYVEITINKTPIQVKKIIEK